MIPLLSSLDRTHSGVMNGPYSPVTLSHINAEKRALDGKSYCSISSGPSVIIRVMKRKWDDRAAGFRLVY